MLPLSVLCYVVKVFLLVGWRVTHVAFILVVLAVLSEGPAHLGASLESFLHVLRRIEVHLCNWLSDIPIYSIRCDLRNFNKCCVLLS